MWFGTFIGTYTELAVAFCGELAAVELRALFFSVLALFLLVLFGIFVVFFDSLALSLEALLFDCLESFDFNVEALSIITFPGSEDNELFVCRPDDLAPFFAALIVGDIFHWV